MHAWAGEDVNDFKEEEFDFQANLNMFDKEKVFAEIRVLVSFLIVSAGVIYFGESYEGFGFEF